jgi:hypothetical protein
MMEIGITGLRDYGITGLRDYGLRITALACLEFGNFHCFTGYIGASEVVVRRDIAEELRACPHVDMHTYDREIGIIWFHAIHPLTSQHRIIASPMFYS